NARLNIGGSFYGSSASSILFEDGEFSATDLENPPVLTINAPIGLGFRDNPGDIVNRIGTTKPEGFKISELIERNQEDLKQFDDSFVGLEVSPGNTLALIGGNVNLDGGNLIAPGGRIEIGGLQKAGIVEFNDDGSLNFPKVITKSNISLSNAVTLVRADGEGSIAINANNLDISNSALLGGIRQGLGFLDAQAGDINLNGTDKIILDNSVIVTRLLTGSIGKAGNINISANSIALNHKSSLNTETFGMGDAGNITFDASKVISLDNGSEALTEVQDIGIGNGGEINLAASSLRLTQGSSLITNTSGQGNAGNITIDVPGQTTLNSGSLILTQVESGAVGNAGDININTGSLASNNGFIIADSKDKGSGGDINLTASDTIQLGGIPKVSENLFPSGIVTGLDQQLDDNTKEFISAGQGGAGNINISARELILNDLAFVVNNIETNTIGEAGEITIDVNLLRVQNNAFVSTFTENEFNAGSITVNAQNLELVSGGKLVTSTDGTGDAGNINLNITDSITIDNRIASSIENKTLFDEDINNELQGRNGLFSNAITNATGNGGSIFIGSKPESVPNNVTIANGGEVRVNGEIKGNAGIIFLKADSLALEKNASIIATTAFGQEGNINLEVSDVITLEKNSTISAAAVKNASGGNIDIDTNFIVAFPEGNNDIIANANRGQGGKISITAESVFGIEARPLNDLSNDINASSNFNLDGTVSINTSRVNPLQGATELPSNVVEPKQNTAQTCSVNREGKANNSLAIAGRGGVHPAPDAPLNSENISNENPAQATIPQPLETRQGKIQPAMGIKVTESGRIVLTAYRTDNAGERIPEEKINCGQI
ncbi:MAG: beta strand repeat-containing protein, partial [Waterburya sp.]